MTSEFPDPHRDSLIERVSCETVTRAPQPVVLLPELPPSQWRSLGKRFDYSTWEARDRFIELDAALVARQQLEILNAQRLAAQSMSQAGRKDDSLPSAA